MRQAAEELGQWVKRAEDTGVSLDQVVARLNAARNRMRQQREREQAETGSSLAPCRNPSATIAAGACPGTRSSTREDWASQFRIFRGRPNLEPGRVKDG
jgi:hypothetical protein